MLTSRPHEAEGCVGMSMQQECIKRLVSLDWDKVRHVPIVYMFDEQESGQKALLSTVAESVKGVLPLFKEHLTRFSEEEISECVKTVAEDLYNSSSENAAKVFCKRVNKTISSIQIPEKIIYNAYINTAEKDTLIIECGPSITGVEIKVTNDKPDILGNEFDTMPTHSVAIQNMHRLGQERFKLWAECSLSIIRAMFRLFSSCSGVKNVRQAFYTHRGDDVTGWSKRYIVTKNGVDQQCGVFSPGSPTESELVKHLLKSGILDVISKILSIPDLSDTIAENVVNSILFFDQAVSSNDSRLATVSLCAALESMPNLISKPTKCESCGQKKISDALSGFYKLNSFKHANTFERFSREPENIFKSLYGYRSRIVHGSSSLRETQSIHKLRDEHTCFVAITLLNCIFNAYSTGLDLKIRDLVKTRSTNANVK